MVAAELAGIIDGNLESRQFISIQMNGFAIYGRLSLVPAAVRRLYLEIESDITCCITPAASHRRFLHDDMKQSNEIIFRAIPRELGAIGWKISAN